MDTPPSYSETVANNGPGRSDRTPSDHAEQSSIREVFRPLLKKFGSSESRPNNTDGTLSTMSSWKLSFTKHYPDTHRTWKPITLNAPILSIFLLTSGGLIAVVQILLQNSDRDNGILFAADINDLPVSKSFSYLYLPTIIAVLYSFLWTWIDLDAKRLEPYYQLSKDSGASGKDSLLLQYPFEFVATVPLKAIKNK